MNRPRAFVVSLLKRALARLEPVDPDVLSIRVTRDTSSASEPCHHILIYRGRYPREDTTLQDVLLSARAAEHFMLTPEDGKLGGGTVCAIIFEGEACEEQYKRQVMKSELRKTRQKAWGPS